MLCRRSKIIKMVLHYVPKRLPSSLYETVLPDSLDLVKIMYRDQNHVNLHFKTKALNYQKVLSISWFLYIRNIFHKVYALPFSPPVIIFKADKLPVWLTKYYTHPDYEY